MFWTAHAPLILSSTDLVYRSLVLNTLARGARHIDRGADKLPPGAPRVAALCGVVAAGVLIPGGDAVITWREIDELECSVGSGGDGDVEIAVCPP